MLAIFFSFHGLIKTLKYNNYYNLFTKLWKSYKCMDDVQLYACACVHICAHACMLILHKHVSMHACSLLL